MWGEAIYVIGVDLAVVMACMLVLWLLSIVLRDVSIVDTFWPVGFAVVAWATFALAEGVAARKWLVVGLTTLWAVRLGIYMLWRKWGEGEDPRYTRFIEHHGTGRRHWTSLTRVFGLQGLIMWIVSLPVIAAQLWTVPETLGTMAYIGAVVCLAGIVFEAVGDWQMARFKADPANTGTVMDRGLWRYTRHPNYFGDACVWFGLFLIACDNPIGVATVISPLLMTYFLLFVTGKALLERRLKKTRADYADYVRRTSGFVPWFPKAR